MAELGKIEKPEASSFKANRKLYVIPVLPFEELALEFDLEKEKIEKFWSEAGGKIDYFVSSYGRITMLFIEGINEDDKIGLEFFEKFGKEGNHYRLIKSLLDGGVEIKGIEKSDYMRHSKLLFEEYSKSFIPEVKKLHEGFYGKDIDFEKWRNYLVDKIQEVQREMSRHASKIIGEMPENNNGVLIITDGRPIEFPESVDVFQIRPPIFDEIVRNIRDQMK